jgi:hypothetical protein
MAKKAQEKPEIKGFYYITHIANIPSILKRGILAHQRVEDGHVPFTPIYDTGIVGNRKNKTTPAGKSLWEYANAYFQPRNPMMYRVKHEKGLNELAVVGVHASIMDFPGAYVTTGNAANNDTDILPPEEGLAQIDWKVINSDWWNSTDGSKRKIMAECLVPNLIPPDRIHSVFVARPTAADKVKELGLPATIPLMVEPKMFFRPVTTVRITPRLSVSEGDMFFSNMQTLTVSVNTVGVMGKGVASRAKYQFPDVYVQYQDAVRRKALRMGRPYVYKRESAIDIELADQPLTLVHPNQIKWFLLFATKSHWRENSDFNGIKEGLLWVRENYKKQGIKSLALPALGCGLGNLSWGEVGPLMCQNLGDLDIDVAIYLPQEHAQSAEWLTPQYLMNHKPTV